MHVVNNLLVSNSARGIILHIQVQQVFEWRGRDMKMLLHLTDSPKNYNRASAYLVKLTAVKSRTVPQEECAPLTFSFINLTTEW